MAGQIRFQTYCEAYNQKTREKGGGAICKALDPSAGAVDVLNAGAAGSGYVTVPEYRVAEGQARIIATRTLYQDGRITRTADGKEAVIAKMSAAVAQRFIEGAFPGEKILRNVTPPDKAMIAGVQQLYSQLNMTASIPIYLEALKTMRKRIAKAEGVATYKYSGAFDAAMACMPKIPDGLEAKYALLKNQYDMGMELLYRAQNKEKEVCRESRSRQVRVSGECKYEYNDTFKRNMRVCEPDGYETRDECVKSELCGRDYTDAELKAFAISYCSTTSVGEKHEEAACRQPPQYIDIELGPKPPNLLEPNYLRDEHLKRLEQQRLDRLK